MVAQPNYGLSTDTTLGGNNPSDIISPSEKAIKTYVDSHGGSAAWGGITGTLSNQTDLKAALDGKQATLVSGTNIKTINSTSILGSGNIDIGSLPSQSGNSGKFLTTNGTTASWADTTKVTIRDWSVT